VLFTPLTVRHEQTTGEERKRDGRRGGERGDGRRGEERERERGGEGERGGKGGGGAEMGEVRMVCYIDTSTICGLASSVTNYNLTNLT
jgi:hypothetical protein